MIPSPAIPLAEIHLRCPWPLPAVASVAAVLATAAALLYARETALRPARRILLATVRAFLFAALLAVLLEPVHLQARKAIVPSNLLVLLDVSESMGIEDPRRRPEDIRDAALALGKLRFREPALQAALARASRALESCRSALARDAPESASRTEEAREALAAALKVARKAAEPGAETESKGAGSGTAAGQAVPRLEDLLERAGSLIAGGEGRAGDAGRIREELEGLLASMKDPAEPPPVAEGLPSPGFSPAETGSPRRIDLARGILAHPDLGFLRAAGESTRVRHYRFGEALEPKGEGESDAEAAKRAEPTAKSTCLGSAVEEAVARHAGQAIDGVVLLTDGASNEGLDPLEAARRLKERSIPIFPVGIGIPSPDDVAVQSVIAADAALAGEPVRARAEVAASGFLGRSIEIVAALDGAEVARKPIVLEGPRAIVEMEFEAPAKGGAANIEVSVAPLPGEVSTGNNRASRRIEIIDEKIKVLYVEGKPRWEYRYLRAVLLRDPRLEVRFLLTEGDPDLPRTSPGYLARFPEEMADAGRYDLVILGNVPARAFTPAQLGWLADLVVKHGGSFLLVAGDQAPASYSGTPIADLLPVALSGAAPLPVEPTAHPVPTEAGLRSGVLALDDAPGRTEALWSMVRPLHRLPSLGGPKPGATVLAVLSGDRPGGPYPAIAWSRPGTGKSLFVATDSLWRLRYGRGDIHHARFWAQAIRFLTLSRLLGENRRIRIEAPRQCRAGERIEVHAVVLDEAFEPARAPSYALEVSAGHLAGPRPLRLDPVPGSPGLYAGSFVPDREATFALRPAGEGRDLAKPFEVVVAASNREALAPDLQEDILRKMAEVSGGRYLEVRDLPALAAVLPLKPATRTVNDERELWDRWFVLAIVLLLGGIEWLVRRRHDLP